MEEEDGVEKDGWQDEVVERNGGGACHGGLGLKYVLPSKGDVDLGGLEGWL